MMGITMNVRPINTCNIIILYNVHAGRLDYFVRGLGATIMMCTDVVFAEQTRHGRKLVLYFFNAS